MAMRRKYLSERDQLALFRALPGDLAPRDAQDLMAYPFFSLAKTKRVVPIDFRAGAITIRVEAVPEHGNERRIRGGRRTTEKSDLAEPKSSRFRGDRRGEEAASQGAEECAPVHHSIT